MLIYTTAARIVSEEDSAADTSQFVMSIVKNEEEADYNLYASRHQNGGIKRRCVSSVSQSVCVSQLKKVSFRRPMKEP